MQFAKNLSEIKTERNLTNTKIAELAGVSEGAVRRWLDGSKLPGIAPFKLLCDGLELDADRLLGDTDNSSPTSKPAALDGEEPILDEKELIIKEISEKLYKIDTAKLMAFKEILDI